MPIKISTVRQKIAAQIATLSGFHQPKLPPEYLGRITDTIAHKAFGVEVNQVVNIPERQRLTVGVYVQSTIIVKFAYRLRPHDTYPIDYDASFDAVEDVIQKVLASLKTSVPSKIVRIKINEVVKLIGGLRKKHMIEDKDMIL